MGISQMSQILGCESRQNNFFGEDTHGKLRKVGDRAWFLGCLHNKCSLATCHREKIRGSSFFLSIFFMTLSKTPQCPLYLFLVSSILLCTKE